MLAVPGDARASALDNFAHRVLSTGSPDRLFPRIHRLVSSGDYVRVYRSRWRGRTGPFGWHARTNKLKHPRLGLAVPKRVVKRATARSRIKRLVRESFRHNRSRLPPVDIVVSVKALPGDLHDPALHRAIDSIWRDVLSTAQDVSCP